MRTVNQTIHTFGELDDDAKEKARDWYRRSTANDTDWGEYVIELVRAAGTCLGIEVDSLNYSLGHTQSDYAAFNGRYAYRKGWRKALKAELGGDLYRTLEAIGEALQDVQKGAFYQLTAACRAERFGRQDVDVFANAEYGVHVVTYADDLRDALRRFSRWIYQALRDEYEWQSSDAEVDESIRANGYEFTKDGDIHPGA